MKKLLLAGVAALSVLGASTASTIPRSLVTIGRPFHTGERVRNIGKLAALTSVASAPVAVVDFAPGSART